MAAPGDSPTFLALRNGTPAEFMVVLSLLPPNEKRLAEQAFGPLACSPSVPSPTSSWLTGGCSLPGNTLSTTMG
jgi:hypothetical protein